MRRRIIYLFLAVLLVTSLIVGCGSSKSTESTADAPAANQSITKSDIDNGAYYGAEPGKELSAKDEYTSKEAEKPAEDQVEVTGIATTGTEGSNVTNEILSQRKIIRNANVTIEVENFDITYGKIQTLVEHSGYGYIQQSRVGKQGSLHKNGMIVVRIQSEKFSDILNSIKGLGEVIDASENTDDVTEKFYDIESELRLLKYEQSRLEEYLNKLTDPESIFKTEDKLTEIRHRIEGLTGTLNKLSDLIKLSTITININEKESDSNKDESYWSELSSGFRDSIKGVVTFFANLLLFIVQALPVIILLALFVWIGALLYKKISKHRKINNRVEGTKDLSEKNKDVQ